MEKDESQPPSFDVNKVIGEINAKNIGGILKTGKEGDSRSMPPDEASDEFDISFYIGTCDEKNMIDTTLPELIKMVKKYPDLREKIIARIDANMEEITKNKNKNVGLASEVVFASKLRALENLRGAFLGFLKEYLK